MDTKNEGYQNTYQFYNSPEIEKLLETAEAKGWVVPIVNMAVRFAELLIGKYFSATPSLCRIDTQILITSIQSAYVDIKSVEKNHTMRRGPSPSKQAAAVTCWINRFCPIQFTEDWTDKNCLRINSVLAFETGWGLKWRAINEALEGPLSAGDLLKRKSKSTDRFLSELIIYDLIWRNPGFKELTTLFECLPPRGHI